MNTHDEFLRIIDRRIDSKIGRRWDRGTVRSVGAGYVLLNWPYETVTTADNYQYPFLSSVQPSPGDDVLVDLQGPGGPLVIGSLGAVVSSVPAGIIAPFGGSTPPTGWLVANGASVATATYPDLFAVIGYTYGGAGASFNLPDLRGRLVVGQNTGDVDYDTLGETGGAKTHTHTGHSNHAFTQPSNHSAHSNHVFTQPSAHSNHVFTQPSAHSNHVFTQPSAHSALGTHKHETVFIDNGPQSFSGVGHDFGSGTSRTRWRTSATSVVSGSYAVAMTQSVTAGTPSAHAGGAVNGHSAHAGGAVDAHSAHSGGAVDAHSAHSAHTGGAVDAHSAHDSPDHKNPYIVLSCIIKF